MTMNVRVRGISYYVSHYQLLKKVSVSLSSFFSSRYALKARPSTAPPWPTRNVPRSESAITHIWQYKMHNWCREIYGTNIALSFVHTKILFFVYSSDCPICWKFKEIVTSTDIKPSQYVDQSNNLGDHICWIFEHLCSNYLLRHTSVNSSKGTETYLDSRTQPDGGLT